MRHEYTPDARLPGRRCRTPEPYSAEQDLPQQVLALRYLEAQKSDAKAKEDPGNGTDCLSAVLAAKKQIATANLTLDQSLEFIAELMRRITGGGGAAIALRDRQEVVCRGRSGPLAPELSARVDPQSGISGACLRSGEIQLCNDTEYDQRVDMRVCRSLGIRSILAVPFRRQQDVIGILEVFSGWASVFGELDIRALKLLADLVIETLWSHGVTQQRAAAPQPVDQPEAPARVIGAICQPEKLAEVIAVSAPPPIATVAEVVEAPALIEAVAKHDAELPAPAFAALGSTEPRHILRMVAIVAAAFVTLAVGTEGLLWRGAHVRELFHLGPAVVPRTTLEQIPSPAGAVEASPQISSGPAAAGAPSQLLSIRSWSKPERTTVALFLKAPARWGSSMLRDPDRIYFDLENTRLPGELLAKSRTGLAIQVNDGLVNRIRVARRDTSAVRIVIELAAAAQYTAVLSPTEPYRLMIVILGTQVPMHAPQKRPEA